MVMGGLSIARDLLGRGGSEVLTERSATRRTKLAASGGLGARTCGSSTSTATRPPPGRWWRGSRRWPGTTSSSSWRCAAATPTPSTATASSTSCRPSVELVHGPGCPVCVIPMGRVDDAIAVAKEPGVIFTSFGDMMRVPGSQGNLLKAKAEGADVRFVYSPLDALRIAVDNPERQVVFFAVGFETTAPSTALTLLQARAAAVTNFSVFSNHVTIVPPIKAILESPDLRLDGFLGPGHVSTVVGPAALPVRAAPSTASPS